MSLRSLVTVGRDLTAVDRGEEIDTLIHNVIASESWTVAPLDEDLITRLGLKQRRPRAGEFAKSVERQTGSVRDVLRLHQGDCDANNTGGKARYSTP